MRLTTSIESCFKALIMANLRLQSHFSTIYRVWFKKCLKIKMWTHRNYLQLYEIGFNVGLLRTHLTNTKSSTNFIFKNQYKISISKITDMLTTIVQFHLSKYTKLEIVLFRIILFYDTDI